MSSSSYHVKILKRAEWLQVASKKLFLSKYASAKQYMNVACLKQHIDETFVK